MKYLNRSFSVPISNPDFDRIFKKPKRRTHRRWTRPWCPYTQDFLTIRPPRETVYCPFCATDGRQSKLEWR